MEFHAHMLYAIGLFAYNLPRVQSFLTFMTFQIQNTTQKYVGIHIALDRERKDAHELMTCVGKTCEKLLSIERSIHTSLNTLQKNTNVNA